MRREDRGMTIASFEIRILCSCGRTTDYACALARPGGSAPVSCACGRKFVLQELEADKVVSVAVDPLGTTGGEIPEDPPEFH